MTLADVTLAELLAVLVGAPSHSLDSFSPWGDLLAVELLRAESISEPRILLLQNRFSTIRVEDADVLKKDEPIHTCLLLANSS